MARKNNIVLASWSAGIDADLKQKLNYRASRIQKMHVAGKKLLFEIALELYEARNDCIEHDSESTFSEWLESVGIPKSTAYQKIAVWERIASPTVGQITSNGGESWFEGLLCFAAFDDSALYELSRPNVPESAVREAFKIASRGDGMTKKQSIDLIASHSTNGDKPRNAPARVDGSQTGSDSANPRKPVVAGGRGGGNGP